MADPQPGFAMRVAQGSLDSTVSFFHYFVANLWTLLPATLAFLVIATVANVLRVPDACTGHSKTINWLLCDAKPNPIDALFNDARARLEARKGGLPDKVAADLKQTPVNAELRTDIAVAAREANGRILWSASFGTLVIVSLVVIVVSLLLVGQGLQGHRRAMVDVPQGLTGPMNLRRAGRATLHIIQFTALSAIILALALLIVLAVVGAVFGRERSGIFAILALVPTQTTIFHDEIMNALTGNFRQVQGYLDIGYSLLCTSMTLLALLVSSTLYQAPGDAAFRARTTVDDAQDSSYLRYLGRSFRRLKLAIYFGAALLVTLVAELSAQFNWALSFLSDEASDPMPKALSDFGQQMTTEIGFAFTLLLAALYFPAIVIIRERARDYYRARNPNDTLEKQETFLSDQGLVVTVPSSYSDFLALLAPLATATAAHLFTILGRG